MARQFASSESVQVRRANLIPKITPSPINKYTCAGLRESNILHPCSIFDPSLLDDYSKPLITTRPSYKFPTPREQSKMPEFAHHHPSTWEKKTSCIPSLTLEGEYAGTRAPAGPVNSHIINFTHTISHITYLYPLSDGILGIEPPLYHTNCHEACQDPYASDKASGNPATWKAYRLACREARAPDRYLCLGKEARQNSFVLNRYRVRGGRKQQPR
ncbi:hypothetical protein P280DRAFT_329927 [Massarina eburnea CBS 473.64]|uniref:Uncharacterized protein n=1 Tax=Massarina eburnea CBS 473.64 TaxID=1395130 RepID=A0A6A6S014_9PLEO|nr:hypothetical protein P280DRAFT_329927 [Massarina eburnea CBS 473.64]